MFYISSLALIVTVTLTAALPPNTPVRDLSSRMDVASEVPVVGLGSRDVRPDNACLRPAAGIEHATVEDANTAALKEVQGCGDAVDSRRAIRAAPMKVIPAAVEGSGPDELDQLVAPLLGAVIPLSQGVEAGLKEGAANIRHAVLDAGLQARMWDIEEAANAALERFPELLGLN